MFAKRLKELREERELTQWQLGKLVNLSQQTIGHYEVSRARPDLEMIGKFADLFNVSTDYLLGRTACRRALPAEPYAAELKDLLKGSDVRFNGLPLDDADKEDIIDFMRLIWKRRNK